MPLSFYPGKTDQQLLNGLSAMDAKSFCASLTADQEWEFWGWFNSPEVQALMHENITSNNWAWGYALWLKFNLLVVLICVVSFRANSSSNMHFVGWWLTIASLTGVIAPIKVKHWFIWTMWAVITLVMLMIATG